MFNPLIFKEITAISVKNPLSIPLEIEYEKLERDLQDRINQKYNIIDNRTCKIEPKTVVPGVSNKISNQSNITFESIQTKPAYPTSTIPYSQGVIWE